MRRKRKQLPVHRNDGTSSVAASSNGTNSSSQATVATARRCLIKYSLSLTLSYSIFFPFAIRFPHHKLGPLLAKGLGVCLSLSKSLIYVYFVLFLLREKESDVTGTSKY